MTQSRSLGLDATGAWMLHRVSGRDVYMRASVTDGGVAVRCGQGGAVSDLGVACDLDRSGGARFVVNPHQADWAKTAAVQADLLGRAQAVWRRRNTAVPGGVATVQAGPHVYDFWADLAATRVEITRRTMRPETVVIDEYLGYADRPASGAPEIRLREKTAIPALLLSRMRALASDAWHLTLERQPYGGTDARR